MKTMSTRTSGAFNKLLRRTNMQGVSQSAFSPAVLHLSSSKNMSKVQRLKDANGNKAFAVGNSKVDGPDVVC